VVSERESAGVLSVAVCTRNRSHQLHAALDDLLSAGDFPVVVVDQSDVEDARLLERARSDDRLTVVTDHGRGLSRARNLAVRATAGSWIAFVDDDCRVERDWAAELVAFLRSHPDADFVSGSVLEGEHGEDEYLPVTTSPVDRERRIEGRWVRPWELGFGVCMAVRRTTVDRLGGWDERLGPGVPDFPAADDMDFNWRLLRSGGVAYLTPRVRAVHEQWRSREQLGPLYRGYMRAWTGFSMKHLRRRDVAGGIWLWLLGAQDAVRMLASAARRRSRFRLVIAVYKLEGLAVGTVKGALRRW
jgi:GT2 family glycosyltransferase